MKVRAQSQMQSHHKSRGFNTKGYFCKVQPYSEEYLKAKHQAYEKTRKMRQAKYEGKQNSGVMLQFEKPKSGFYELKGCKIQKSVHGHSKQNLGQNVSKNKPQYLAYFLKKYTQRKQKKQRIEEKQYSQILLPAVKYSILPKNHESSKHCQSMGLQLCPISQNSRVNYRRQKSRQKMRTEPINQKHQSRSCQQLYKHKQEKRKATSIKGAKTQYLIKRHI